MDTQWTTEIEADFEEWLKTHSLDDYANVDWSKKKETAEDEETLLG